MFRYAFFLVLITFCGTVSYGQYYKRSYTDSLEKSIVGQEGITRVKTLIHLSEIYYEFSLDTALLYARQSRMESRLARYDWGVYKSIYLESRVASQMFPADEVVDVLRHCSKWFYSKGYYEDGIVCDLLLSELMSRLKGTYAVLDFDREILEKARKIKNNRLQGFAWFSIKRHKSQIVEDNFDPGALDSARYYYSLAGDSAQLTLTCIYDILLNNGKPKGFKIIHEELARVNRWGNTKLSRTMNAMALLGHSAKGNQDSVAWYFDKTMDLIERRGGEYAEMQAYNFLGYAARIKDDIPAAIENYQKAKELCIKFQSYGHLCTILKEISKLYLRQNQNELAIKYLLEAIEYAKIQEDDYVLYTSKIYLGKIYKNIGEFEKARDLCLDAIPWIESTLSGKVMLKTRGAGHFILGEIYQQKAQYDSALTYFERACEDYSSNDAVSTCWARVGVMSVYLDAGEFEKAKTTYHEILEACPEQTRAKGEIFFLAEGRLMIANKEYDKGIAAIEHYLSVAQVPYYSEELKKAHLSLYQGYESIGNYDKALKAHINYKAIDDSLSAGREVRNVIKLQSDYEISLREATIADLNKQQELNDLRITQQDSKLKLRQSYILVLIVIICFVLIVGVLLFRRFRLKKEREKERLKAGQMELELENLKTRKQVEIAEVKNTLFANVSHEFRTPLTLIKVPVQSYMEKVPEQDQSIFKGVLSNADQLLTMVDELLNLGKMEAGQFKLSRSRFNLMRFFAEIKSNFGTLFHEKKVRFRWSVSVPDASFHGDENQLKMVLNNLLKNAYEHVPVAGFVEFSVAPVQAGLNEGLQIDVSNSGSKISRKDLPHIFDRFYRASEEHYVGNGIGLSLSRQIVEMHSGRINVENNTEEKVTFRIKLPGRLLPLEKEQVVSQGTGRNEKQETGSGEELNTVLIVEDNPEMSQLLGDLLKDEFNIHFAMDGQKGEEMSIELQPDLILSDVMMPRKDGFELLKSLKENVETSHIPVLLLTARTDLDSKIMGLEQDAIDYLAKPFNPKELKARIKNILRQRRQLQQILTENPFVSTRNIKIPQPDKLFLDRARSILEAHFHNGDFSVVEFCSELGLNRNSTYKKIKAYTNQTTSEYMKNFRLEKALKMLLETNNDIAEVYTNTGFNSAQAFNKAFKSRFKYTPSEYRKRIHEKSNT